MGEAEPSGPGTFPVACMPTAWWQSREKPLATRVTSTCSPRRVAERRCSAAMMAMAAHMPVVRSMSEAATRTGTSGLPGHAHQPGEGLQQGVVAGQAGSCPGSPEGGDRAVDDGRVSFPHVPVAESEGVRGAGAEALHHHVGRLRELQEGLSALLVLEVEDDAALVAVHGVEDGALVPSVGHAARVAVAAGSLDLDHVGAEGAEDHRAVGAGDGGLERLAVGGWARISALSSTGMRVS